MMRLTFIKPEDYKPSLGDVQAGLSPETITGPDAESILGQWNKIGWARAYDPTDFRQKLLDYSGGNSKVYVKNPCNLPALDDHILEAVVEASGPERMTLEEFQSAQDSIQKALRQGA